MIVSDDTVTKALAYIAEDPHPLADAERALLFAEKEKDEIFAELYLETQGTAKERESQVILDERYKAARTAEIDAEFDKKRHDRRSKAAEKIFDIWQTQNANARMGIK